MQLSFRAWRPDASGEADTWPAEERREAPMAVNAERENFIMNGDRGGVYPNGKKCATK